MWKCKRCKGTTFEIKSEITNLLSVEYDEKGFEWERVLMENEVTEVLSCSDCGNRACSYESIKDIADWVDE